MTFVLVLAGWIASLCLHEFSHAVVAYWGGDLSVKDKGYLTLNPMRYTHPAYTFVLPILFLLLGGIGLPGGAVYIDRSRLRSKAWQSASSLAGPASNALLGFVIGLLLHVPAIASSPAGPALAFLGLLQVWALVLNLLPLPPLDGFGAIAPYLPDHLRAGAYRLGSNGVLLLFLLLWFTPANDVFWDAVRALSDMLGIPLRQAAFGLYLFQFWRH
jgi:Zn-dependent protease